MRTWPAEGPVRVPGARTTSSCAGGVHSVMWCVTCVASGGELGKTTHPKAFLGVRKVAGL